jgi:hypothetical protein
MSGSLSLLFQIPAWLFLLLYWPSLPSTLLGVDSLQALSFWSHTTSRTYPVQPIQEKVTFDRADDHFNLEVLTPMEGVSLSIGTWDSSSPSRVFDEAVRLRGLSDERNMTRLYNMLRHPHMGGKAASETVKILFSTIPISSDLHDHCIFHRFLCSPTFRKSRDEISFKGGCNIPYFGNPIQSY